MRPSDFKQPTRRFFQTDQRRAPQVDLKFDEDFLTTEQVRQRFGLKSINCVYRLVREYDLPRVNLGGRFYRFKPSAIAAWLQQQQEAGGLGWSAMESNKSRD